VVVVGKCPSCLNCAAHHLSLQLLPGNLQSPAQDQLRSLSRSGRRFYQVPKWLSTVRLRLGPQLCGGIKRYDDALFEGAFGMQLLVHSVPWNQDTFLSLRSSWASVVLRFHVIGRRSCEPIT